MGTSKGYIPPKTIKWSQAKRAVTGFARNGDSDSKAFAVAKFAEAMKSDVQSAAISNAVEQLISFAGHASTVGINNALRDWGREDLIGKSSEEIWSELLNQFTNEGASTEDYLAADALTGALEYLQVKQIEELENISADVLLKEVLIAYIQSSFAFRYSEQIGQGHTPVETKRILDQARGCISLEIRNTLDMSDINSINYKNIKDEKIGDKYLQKAWDILIACYPEVEK